MMNQCSFLPPPDLAEVVRCFWTLEIPCPSSTQTLRFLPDGCPEWIIQLGAPIRYQVGTATPSEPQTISLMGPLRHFVDWHQQGHATCVLVKFQPWALGTLLRTDARLLADKVLPWDGGQLPPAHTIAQPAQLIPYLETYLRHHFAHANLDPDVTAAVKLANHKSGVGRTSELTGQLPIGTRRLEQKFAYHVGLSPKFYARTLRMHAAAHALAENPHLRLTELAIDMGYYDQAHFIRDFRQFAGLSPKAFLKGRHPQPVNA